MGLLVVVKYCCTGLPCSVHNSESVNVHNVRHDVYTDIDYSEWGLVPPPLERNPRRHPLFTYNPTAHSLWQ